MSNTAVENGQSKIYTGTVRHRRFRVRPHEFLYKVFMLYVDIDDVAAVTARSWLWSFNKRNVAALYEKDYLPDYPGTLREKANAVLRDSGVAKPAKKIFLLSHWRILSYAINPISCFYCYNDEGKLQHLILEVTNTPWKERKVYVLECDSASEIQNIQFDKDLHVSPFFSMDMQYQLRCNVPASRLAFHLENHDVEGKAFDATLALEEKDINSVNLLVMLLAYPLMTIQVVSGIYWQALVLWMKKVPVYPHPAKKVEKGVM